MVLSVGALFNFDPDEPSRGSENAQSEIIGGFLVANAVCIILTDLSP